MQTACEWHFLPRASGEGRKDATTMRETEHFRRATWMVPRASRAAPAVTALIFKSKRRKRFCINPSHTQLGSSADLYYFVE